MGTLRSRETEERYRKDIADGALDGECVLCRERAIESFRFWEVVGNDYPYDLIARTHHMLVPLRHATEQELTAAELRELASIKAQYIQPNYEWIIEPTHRKKTIPDHYHLHLIVGKE